MKKIVLLSIVSVIISTSLWAQQKLMTIDEAVQGLYRTMYAEQINYIQWRNNQFFTYVKGDKLYQQSILQAKEEVILTGQHLYEISKDTLLKEIRRFPEYEWISDNTIWIKNNHVFF